MYRVYNPNPDRLIVGDCAVRAISKALDISWEDAYNKLCDEGFLMCDMPSANRVWASVLHKAGFKRRFLPDTCPNCYTVEDFANDHKKGTFVLGADGHVLCVEDGDWYDSWNSKDRVPVYYWER